MLIIVEGIDRVGKTTMTREIATRVPNAQLMRYSTPLAGTGVWQEAVELERLKTMYDVSRSIKEHLVIDRFHLSELVYGETRRGYNCSAQAWAFDKLMAENNDVILVYVRPTDLKRSSLEHGSDLSRDLDLFDAAFAQSALRRKLIVTYNDINIIERKLEQVMGDD